MPSEALRDVDPNLQLGQATPDAVVKKAEERNYDGKLDVAAGAAECEASRDRLQEHKGAKGHLYVSPSDAIMSPATKKLSGLKQRRFEKGGVRQKSLFAKAVTSRERDLGPE
ncbi:hypothetical protein CAC42_5157 [Sphaceloma murrayae]|uniref:Uncharacterized protein n=1 Tax=Sphaceloma murrayae TaxID=2082308 RepID=A0A2K1QU72_9PEZI|nr:hypothetical protein CAC42_5157 [Sphaceloma murrayae]